MSLLYFDSLPTNRLATENEGPQLIVPPNILALILIHTVQRNLFDFSNPARSFSEASRIGRVCRAWRHVSLATPELWATMALCLDSRGWNPAVLERLQVHLDRSMDARLRISVESEDGLQDKRPLFPFMKDLDRIFSLKIQTRAHVDFGKVAQQYIGRASNILVHSPEGIIGLTLDKTKHVQSAVLIPSATFFSHAELGRFTWILPSVHLTHLHLKCYPQSAMTMLRDCHNLIHGHFILPPYGFIDAEPAIFVSQRAPSNYIVRALETLIIEVVNASRPGRDYPFPSLAHLFNTITTPSLYTLALLSDANQNPYSIYPSPSAEFLTALINLIYRSLARIQNAEIIGVPIAAYDLVPLFKSLRWVKSVTLGEAKGSKNKIVTTGLLGLLTSSALPYTVLLPELQQLQLQIHDLGWAQGAFEAMLDVRSRRGLHSVLVVLNSERELLRSRIDMGHLRGLQRDGLAIRLITHQLNTGRVILGY